jgi:hypothetical protein
MIFPEQRFDWLFCFPFSLLKKHNRRQDPSNKAIKEKKEKNEVVIHCNLTI